MKNIVLIFAFLFAGFSAKAEGNAAEDNTSAVILKQIRLPEELKAQKLNETVKVSFTVTESGTARLIEVHTGNNELGNYVAKKFRGLDLSTTGLTAGETYFIDINFKVL